ncbi:MAG TPA: hypothetical protein VHW68_13825 [Actinomycetota bacterium]|jgi:hypothetical protein|nr:hypothetical protein [Actinomycetota bacterium]
MNARRIATAMVVATAVLLVVRFTLALSTGSLTDQAGWLINTIYAGGVIIFPAMLLFVGWSIGAELQVASEPGRGTVVAGRVPVEAP